VKEVKMEGLSGRLVVCCCLFVFLFQVSWGQLEVKTVKKWGDGFGQRIVENLEKATRKDSITSEFNSNANLRVEDVDGAAMLEKMVKKVEKMLDDRVNAVKNIANKAEEFALHHVNNEDLGRRLKEGNFSYVSAKESTINMTDSYKELLLDADHPDDHFNVPIDTSESSVHMPTDIFHGINEVVNGLDWSSKLDDVFKENYEKYPLLSWQFFGSSTGFMRIYPGMQYHVDERRADLYDVRMQEWYTKSAMSAKNIVILLDTSGSMTTEARMSIGKYTIIKLLETLTEDDFFTVLTFSGDTKPLMDCFVDSENNTDLVRANARTKASVIENLVNIKTENIANFTSGLSTAFQTLERFEEKGASCNQAIMLITDGIVSKEDELFEKYNKDKKIRMFTYYINLQDSAVGIAKEISCENHGYFTHISTLSEVKEQILKYIPVMSRPLVISDAKPPAQWTTTHVYGQNMENGVEIHPLRTSVSFPAYDKIRYENVTIEEGDPVVVTIKQVPVAKLLGVASASVPVDDIKNMISQYQLGIDSYSFMVNNNGHILYHPLLKEESRRNIGGTDMTDLEIAHDGDPLTNMRIAKMREDMTEQKSGNIKAAVDIPIDNGRRVISREQEYFFRKIDGTPFSVGIVVPTGVERSQVRGDSGSKDVGKLFENKMWNLQEDWIYFANDDVSPAGLRQLTRLEKTYPDDDLDKAVVLDAEIVKKVFDGIDVNESEGVEQLFITTRSGLSHWKDANDTTEFTAKSNRETWFQGAVDFNYRNENSFFFTPNKKFGVITASQAIFKKDGDKKAVAAVVGVEMNVESVQDILDEVTGSPMCNGTDYNCYLLDDAGYVITASDPEHSGMFIGQIEGNMFSSLEDNGVKDHGVFKKTIWKNDDNTCLEHVSKDKLGRNNYKPIPCSTETSTYQRSQEFTDKKFNDTLVNCNGDCGNKDFIGVLIPQTNLILVVVTNSSCPCNNIVLSDDPVKMDYDATVQCKNVRKTADMPRTNMEFCKTFLNNEDEDEMDCGGANGQKASIVLIFLSFFYYKLLSF